MRGGTTLADPQEASGAGVAPAGRVTLTVNGTRRTVSG